jgi:hypothetical protein
MAGPEPGVVFDVLDFSFEDGTALQVTILKAYPVNKYVI